MWHRWVVTLAAVGGWCLSALAATTQPAKVSDEAQVVLNAMAEAYGKLPSLELTGTITLKVEAEKESIAREAQFTSAFLAPNLFRHEIKDQPLVGSTGQTAYAYSKQSGAFVQAATPPGKVLWKDLPPDVQSILAAQNVSLALAISKDPAQQLTDTADQIQTGADQQIEGKPYRVLELSLKPDQRVTMLIDPQTHLVRREITDLTNPLRQRGRKDIKSAELIVDYPTIRPNAPLKPEHFAWSPPEGAKDLVAAARAAKLREEAAEAELAASRLVGEPAPDFELETLDGKPLKLSDLQGSVVVLDFWATWCPPCEPALQRIQKIHNEKQAQGLKVLLVNLREGKPAVKSYVEDKKLTLPTLLDPDGAVAKRYFIEGPPQMIIIGRDGKVKKVGAGFDPQGEQNLIAALDALLK